MWAELCLYLVLNWGAVEQQTCEQIVADAISMGAEKHVYELLAIGWHESRFTASAISGVYIGALQVNPKWAVDCEDCTEIQQAISVFIAWKHKDRCTHISRFMNGWTGVCDERVQARIILADKLKRLHTRIKRRKIK